MSAEAAALPSDVRALLEMLSRAGSLDEAVRIRARLIEVAGDDDRAPTWMVEQAAAMLDRLARDGSEASVLLGMPTPAQRQAAAEAAEEMLRLTALADGAATRAVDWLQARLMESTQDAGTVRAQAQAAERSLARLIDTEQAVRIPYFRGRAAVILAALERDRAPREDFIRVALESLGKLRLGTVAAEASRRVALAATLLLIAEHEAGLAGGGGGAAPEPVLQAAELARWVVDQPAIGRAGEAPDPLTRVQAWMVLLRAPRTRQQLAAAREALALGALTEPFVTGEGEQRSADPLLALLTAEAATRTGLSLPAPASSSRIAHINEAFAPLIALLTREDLAAHRRALRPVVLSKIGGATDALMPLGEADPTIALARAVTLARGSGPGDAARAEASALLRGVADRPEAGELRADALWELAVLRWEEGGPEAAVDAVGALVRLASELHDSPRAEAAAKKAVELGRYTLAQFTAAPPADEGLKRQLSALYARALELAVHHAPSAPESAENRLERARLALEPRPEEPGAAMTPEELDAALDALEGVPPGDARGAEADRLAQEAIERAMKAAAEAVRRAASADGPGSLTFIGPARERQVAIARRAVQWASVRRPREADRYRLALADALLASGDARAAAVYEDIASRAGAMSELSLRARLGLARAQRAGKQAEAAFATLRALTDDLERSAQASAPGSRERHEVYWLAWAEMLEILAADNRDGRRTDTIRLQLKRLSLVDPQFGGGEARERLETVRAGLK